MPLYTIVRWTPVSFAADFGQTVLDAATAALPYIGAGVAAGVVIFAVTFGIRKGLSALRTVGR